MYLEGTRCHNEGCVSTHASYLLLSLAPFRLSASYYRRKTTGKRLIAPAHQLAVTHMRSSPRVCTSLHQSPSSQMCPFTQTGRCHCCPLKSTPARTTKPWKKTGFDHYGAFKMAEKPWLNHYGAKAWYCHLLISGGCLLGLPELWIYHRFPPLELQDVGDARRTIQKHFKMVNKTPSTCHQED